MKIKKQMVWVVAPVLVAGVLAIRANNVAAQYAAPPGSAEVAVANVVEQHTHSIVLMPEDVAALIASLSPGQSVSFESSTGYAGGAVNGVPHTHNVNLSLQDLQTLQNTGTVTVQSEVALGHAHAFTFVMQQNCNAFEVPIPVASPSASPMPSGLPSGMPSGMPSSTPSSIPSVTPTTPPSATPTPTLTLTPIH